MNYEKKGLVDNFFNGETWIKPGYSEANILVNSGRII